MKTKSNLIILAVLCCVVIVAMPATRDAVAGVSEKVAKAHHTLNNSPSLKARIRAVRSLGDANDCAVESGDCSKATATAELVRIAEDCSNRSLSNAAKKELNKDLNRSMKSPTRRRVEAAAGRGI